MCLKSCCPHFSWSLDCLWAALPRSIGKLGAKVEELFSSYVTFGDISCLRSCILASACHVIRLCCWLLETDIVLPHFILCVMYLRVCWVNEELCWYYAWSQDELLLCGPQHSNAHRKLLEKLLATERWSSHKIHLCEVSLMLWLIYIFLALKVYIFINFKRQTVFLPNVAVLCSGSPLSAVSSSLRLCDLTLFCATWRNHRAG